MFIDHDTLEDLGLLLWNDRSGALFQSLDHTMTPEGRNALWRQFANPLSSVKEIRQRQQLLQSFIPQLPALDLRELRPLIERVEQYLRSSYVLVPSLAIRRVVLRIRYADMLSEIAEGVQALGELLHLAEEIESLLAVCPGDIQEAQTLAATIRECLEAKVHVRLAGAVQKKHRSYLALCRFDKAVRGDPRITASIRALIAALHHFDALRSLALVSARSGWHFPDVVQDAAPCFDAKDLVYPTLPDAVPSDVTLGEGAPLLYVTGPNMAGKTTFLKSCALAVLFSHVGMTVPAASLRISLYDRVFAALSVRDSIAHGESFFLAEVRRVKKLAGYVVGGERVFAVVDEMFKGTNVLDATEATRLVVEGLARQQRGSYVISSHITDFTTDLANDAHIQLGCFSGEISGADLRFSYRLTPGVSTLRMGMEFLEREGIVRMLAAGIHNNGNVKIANA